MNAQLLHGLVTAWAPTTTCRRMQRRPFGAARPVERCRRQTIVGVDRSDGASTSAPTSDPWGFGFQMNERFLVWDESATTQLIKLHCCRKLDLSIEEVEERLRQLGTLVPDIINKLPRMRADIILQLIKDPAATTAQLLGLRDLLPNANISLLVTRWPFIMTEFDLPTLQKRLEEIKSQLPGVRVEALIDMEPQLLKVDINQVLANIRRIMPDRDPVEVLVAAPHMVLDMQQAGMDSALDVEGIPNKQQKKQA